MEKSPDEILIGFETRDEENIGVFERARRGLKKKKKVKHGAFASIFVFDCVRVYRPTQ